MKFFRMMLQGVAALMVASAVTLSTGCDGGGDGGGGGGSDVVGTWALYPGSTIQGSPVWYINFNKDKTYNITDNADGSGERVYGTYTQDGNTITGPFTNPGVGDGRIDATVTDGVMQLNFVEYWHSPHKVVPYAGNKI